MTAARRGLLLALALLLVACGGGGDSVPSAPTSTPDETLPGVIAAREDLVARFEIAPEELEVISVTPKAWPDTCLGVTYASQRDEVCEEVVTSGYEVVLRLGETDYTYHTDDAATIVRFADIDVGGD